MHFIGGVVESPAMEAHAADNDGVVISAKTFPNEAFREYVKNNFDSDGDGKLSDDELGNVKEIDFHNCGWISFYFDLTGVEYFHALQKLNCSPHILQNLDVSKNINLTELYCRNSELKNLDVSKNVNLTVLYCNDNQLTNLDVSKNVNLTELNCGKNRLVALDLSNNRELEFLECDLNLRSFDDRIIEGKSYVALSDLEQYGFNKDRLEDKALTVKLDDGVEYLCLGEADETEKKMLTYAYNTGSSNEECKTVQFTIARNIDPVEINEVNFPDETFREYVKTHFDSDGDGKLSDDELGNVIYIC